MTWKMFLDDLRMPDDFGWYIHSQNPIGAEHIKNAMKDLGLIS
jgi:hypothetical protein